MNTANFMVVVTAIIEKENGKMLLIKRSPKSELPNCWEDVGGRLKQSEHPEEGLRREIKEETGIKDIEIVKPLTTFHAFRKGIKKKENEIIGIAYWCKTRTSEVTLSDEHIDYQWIFPEDAMNITGHPILRNYLKIYLAEKKKLEKVIMNNGKGI